MDYVTDYRYEAVAALEDEPLQPLSDLADYLRQYARERPEMTALVCLGIGFILGWKLKPW